LLVVDEAYIEFSEQASAIELIGRYEHVAVLRTLSKAWALAGARIGTLIAHPDVIGLIRRIMPPYPLPTPCVAAALSALSPSGQQAAREHIAIVREQRASMRDALSAVPGVREVLPSDANFLAVRFDDAGAAYQHLQQAGIVVRDVRRYPKLQDALRITIGTPEENAKVLAILSEMTLNKVQA
jgi:histidinol-phosphate aminotransferase